jgi:hypothetical protein
MNRGGGSFSREGSLGSRSEFRQRHFLASVLVKLQIVKPAIVAALGEELLVRADLFDRARLEDDNLIRVQNR